MRCNCTFWGFSLFLNLFPLFLSRYLKLHFSKHYFKCHSYFITFIYIFFTVSKLLAQKRFRFEELKCERTTKWRIWKKYPCLRYFPLKGEMTLISPYPQVLRNSKTKENEENCYKFWLLLIHNCTRKYGGFLSQSLIIFVKYYTHTYIYN